jgi:hypothetical protein
MSELKQGLVTPILTASILRRSSTLRRRFFAPGTRTLTSSFDVSTMPFVDTNKSAHKGHLPRLLPVRTDG